MSACGSALILAAAAAFSATLSLTSAAKADPLDPQTPQTRLGPLYVAVEMAQVFPDSKTFADAVPLAPAGELLALFENGRPWTQERLKAFVAGRFQLPTTATPAPSSDPHKDRADLRRHIFQLWGTLTRSPERPPTGSSAIAVPEPFVVPGGRFRELYYWDSYFTMLGLKLDGKTAALEAMIEDFGSLIDRFGHIPNGTRSYYVSRSQPPFFFAMAALSSKTAPAELHRRLTWMRREHAFWMAGEDEVKPGETRNHLIRFADGALLNRYHDALSTPRDESYREDAMLAAQSGRAPSEVYSDLRSGAESGWDFSSRWLADGRNLATIQTGMIAPIDLNSLLFGLEKAIARSCEILKDQACAAEYQRRAADRALAINQRLWDSTSGVYRDFDAAAGRRTASLSAATLYPLFVGAAAPGQAKRVAVAARRALLAPGGLRTTTQRTGQQWDAPNGWAPLQWVAVAGLRRYGETALADEIGRRWLATVEREYRASGRLLEKYDVEEVRPGGGGEYPLQDGFGWTNGVTRALLADHPPGPP